MIDSHFEQRLALSEQGDFRIRMMRPDDKQRLMAGFEQLSPESRYQRFFVVKNELTATDLRQLTEFDSRDHVGLGIFELDGEVEGACVAGGRIVRNNEDARVGEVGIAVIDRMQHHGLGKQLIELLIEAGRERGLETIRFDVMPTNKPMRNLVKQLAPEVRFHNHGEFHSAEVPIASADNSGETAPLVQLLCAMMRIARLGRACLRLRPVRPAEAPSQPPAA